MRAFILLALLFGLPHYVEAEYSREWRQMVSFIPYSTGGVCQVQRTGEVEWDGSGISNACTSYAAARIWRFVIPPK